MSESGDYTATSWVPKHDYRDARATYTSSVVDRSYSAAVEARIAPRELVRSEIKLDHPTLVIWNDVTGSMGEWPAVMFGKLPYLMHELKTYLGENAQILIGAVGDATSDDYPLQVQEPKSTFEEAKGALTALKIEGGGGSQTKESYELAAGFMLNAVQVARSVRPVLIFIGDESPYDRVSATQLSDLGIQAENMSTEGVFKALNEVYDIYFIHKPYGTNSSRSAEVTARVKADWIPLLPPQHLVPLSEPERVVDVIFGILAGSVGKVEEFKHELVSRQRPEQVTTVLTSLHGLYTAPGGTPKALRSGKSTMHTLPAGKPSKRLI